MTLDLIPSTPVTPAMARALIQRARAKDFDHGVLAFAARPDATVATTFTDGGQAVQIVPAVSTLAIREAIKAADPDGWLVIVTDRPVDDLGPGLLGQFVWATLRHPDPWDALKQRFAAHSIDARLLGMRQAREVAAGLLEVGPSGAWPPAPAGVLTTNHALGTIAHTELGLPEGPIDLIAVLQWSTTAGLPTRIARLREAAGEPTVEALLTWVADAAGEAGPLVASLLRSGTPTDIVPLGVVLDCLLNADDRHEADLALARLQHRWGQVARGALAATGRLSGVVVTGLLDGTNTVTEARQLLARADDLLETAGAGPLSAGSDLLRSALTHRLRAVADVLGRPHPDASTLEAAWARVAAHRLHDVDPRVRAAHAGVRLARWLRATASDTAPTTLDALAQRHLDVDAWVDSAVNDAAVGVDDHPLAAALERVLADVQQRRDEHDREFAAALSRADGTPGPEVFGLEDVLAKVVHPLAERYPTLLLVLDGLSAGVATEVLTDVTTRLDHTFVECSLPGRSGRTPALAVLPSLTEASRASLLSGRLVTGQQDVERKNFAAFARAHGLGDGPLVHKKGLDTSRPGFELADTTRQDIADVEKYRLVGCVLNTIDDALDRNDPGGTEWSAEAVKHLAPLLRAARAAGRLVILTSDHGHVVERRLGTQRGVGQSGRHRKASGDVQPDEVLVRGPRVLTPGNEAVLAVNERLRYGPLKAGYHGGAAPAEVVVPLVLLAPSTLAHDLVPVPPVEPTWWTPDDVDALPTPRTEAGPPSRTKPPAAQPDLFTAAPEPTASALDVGAALVASGTYKAQRKLVGRLAITDDQVKSLVDALAIAPDRRIAAAKAAALWGIGVNRLPMMVSQLTKLLNVEGYPVVATDPGTGAVTLDAGLLTEQYGVSIVR